MYTALIILYMGILLLVTLVSVSVVVNFVLGLFIGGKHGPVGK